MSEQVITPPRSGRGDIAYSSSTLTFKSSRWSGVSLVYPHWFPPERRWVFCTFSTHRHTLQ